MSSSSPQPAEAASAVDAAMARLHWPCDFQNAIAKVPGDEFDGIYFRGCLSVKLCSAALELPHFHEVCRDSSCSAPCMY